MLFIIHIAVWSRLILSIRTCSSRTTFTTTHNTDEKFKILMPKEVKSLLKNSVNADHFMRRLLPLLLNERTSIQINTTHRIPFYQVDSVADKFPLFRNKVKLRATAQIKNASAKLTILKAAFNKLWKMLRHPRMLQKIAACNFSLWDKKRFMPGKKLIQMFFTTTFNDDFPIIIEILPPGKRWQSYFLISKGDCYYWRRHGRADPS